MNETTKNVDKAEDAIQRHLTSYACELRYDAIPADAVHAAKVRVIDTLGCLIGAFFGEPGRVARALAARLPNPQGATVIGTRLKTTPDMAAFVNAATARDSEMTDAYHYPGSFHGHPSDIVTPILAVAEHVGASGRDYIVSLVLGYEVFLRFSNVFENEGFDAANFTVIASAIAAGRLWGLAPTALSHCISMAAVPNVMLKQVRKGHLSMYKSAAAGHAGRAGVFAAQLARAGMEGPHLPFEGKAGWCDHVARKRFTLDLLGGKGERFKILDTRLKNRPVEGNAIAPILAAEKLAVLRDPEKVAQITVEVFEHALDRAGSGEHQWNPETRETADHSIPYVVAVALLFGKVTSRSFNDAHLWDPGLRSLLPKIRVVENKQFTEAYEKLPVEHHTRVTVAMKDGQLLVGETGGDADDHAREMSDEKVMEKFRAFTEDVLGAKQVTQILDRLWHLDELENVAVIPPDFVLG
jgi:2-methylcitrate dehydratase